MCSVQNRGVASFAPKSLPTLPPQSMLAREDYPYPTSSKAYMKDKKTKVDLSRKNPVTGSPPLQLFPPPPVPAPPFPLPKTPLMANKDNKSNVPLPVNIILPNIKPCL